MWEVGQSSLKEIKEWMKVSETGAGAGWRWAMSLGFVRNRRGVNLSRIDFSYRHLSVNRKMFLISRLLYRWGHISQPLEIGWTQRVCLFTQWKCSKRDSAMTLCIRTQMVDRERKDFQSRDHWKQLCSTWFHSPESQCLFRDNEVYVSCSCQIFPFVSEITDRHKFSISKRSLSSFEDFTNIHCQYQLYFMVWGLSPVTSGNPFLEMAQMCGWKAILGWDPGQCSGDAGSYPATACGGIWS